MHARISSSGIRHWLRVPICSLFIFSLSHATPPPELTVLRQQYEKAYAERVTTVHEASVSALNTRFTVALDNAATAAQQAGKLDDVLAIQDDKKRLAKKLPIPDDDEKTPEALKKLRAIYRAQLKKLEDARATSIATVLPAYQTKLQELETTLTKAGRIEEAKELRDYRATLNVALVPAADTTTQPPATPVPGTPQLPPTTPVGGKAARIHSALVNSRWTTTNWDDAVITLQSDGKVRFSRGGHTLTWEVNKSGELLLSDRGAAPRQARMESRLNKFTISMGSDHECARLDTTTLGVAEGTCSKELILANEGHVWRWKAGESISWSKLSLEPGTYEIILLTHGFRSNLYQFSFKAGTGESTLEFDPTSGGWAKAKETPVGTLSITAKAEKLEAICTAIKPPKVAPKDPKESTFGLVAVILVRSSPVSSN